jgi:hypothetical protein
LARRHVLRAECLYDLKKDPTELNNLIDNPEVSSVLDNMKERMDSYLAAYPKAEPQRPKKADKSRK